MNSKILKYLSFILIIIISGGILLSTFVFIRFNSIVQNFENGILIYSFFTLYICAVMLPILFRKKLKISRTIPLILIFCILSAALINAGAYNIVKNSVSAYSRQNWDNNANLRIYMIEDLEKQYQFFEKTETEVIDFLGHPSNVSYYSGKRLEYYIGDGYIDPYTYDIIIENDVVSGTAIVQH